ncbi:MAG: RnfABCDGE type electron transport complex subunit B [Clostridiaceae bacterium]|jgi:RnfABCDGE-type electron transport complex B subunit|nr:RnfABCDGE type electron transport complex subunit B [Eubacteriales bacterium]NLV47430.1 RnfABCDGE type electron transport complex subunit B [Clostridiaceae bacterium]
MLFTVVLISLPAILIPVGIAAAIALILGIVLVIASKVFALPVDQTLEEVRSALPGVNCGACGYSGCDGYAQALRDGQDTDVSKCSPGGSDTAAELAAILGQAVPSFTPKVAYIHCQGTTDHTSKRFAYHGVETCAAAQNTFSGPNSCTYGCIGFGDCAAVCPYGAIYISKGIAHIDSHLCRACTLCVAACPKNLIEMMPKHYNAYTVTCKNKWPGGQTRKNCTVGCIGCRRCFKVCPSGAITMDGPLAVIDPNLCTHCNKCLEVCPTHAILRGLPLAEGTDGYPKRSRQEDDPVTPAPALVSGQTTQSDA